MSGRSASGRRRQWSSAGLDLGEEAGRARADRSGRDRWCRPRARPAASRIGDQRGGPGGGLAGPGGAEQRVEKRAAPRRVRRRAAAVAAVADGLGRLKIEGPAAQAGIRAPRRGALAAGPAALGVRVGGAHAIAHPRRSGRATGSSTSPIGRR